MTRIFQCTLSSSLKRRCVQTTPLWRKQAYAACLTRSFSSTKPSFENNAEPKEPKADQFPWLLSSEGPRIAKHDYPTSAGSFGFLTLFPKFIQHGMCFWAAKGFMGVNMGADYFPDQFLVGATMALRQAVTSISQQITDPTTEKEEALEKMLGKPLLDRFMEAGKALHGAELSIQVPQVYDAELKDIWINVGTNEAFKNHRKFEIVEWMTFRMAMEKGKDDSPESYSDFNSRITNSWLSAVQINVDVAIDADIVYKVAKGDDVLLYDEGRRSVMLRLGSPYFEPAKKMVSGRDPDTLEPYNDWTWKIVDIDQLLEKEAQEHQDQDEDEDRD
ncbi:uncharacterized protein BYT42DRAFT_578127 [Radiomyces spectabilis]|uniref:uncharacterized protein n=1 Tax=Radiomyces spectabilis TaxID=64574 RepID=UPI00221FD8F9|nr:uncharacterized protein BYT42DRAFT_578127 [Radiomyces spectabilis]KAI8372815.1 hypothetical protein BYT42DRAFT_578127 [Radiomyces spectabilis]